MRIIITLLGILMLTAACGTANNWVREVPQQAGQGEGDTGGADSQK